MRVKSKALSIAWKLALLAFATWGLLDGSGILAGHYLSAFPNMFTNVSNLFAWGYFACAAVWLVVRRADDDAVTFADWLLFDEKGRMPLWGPLAWMSLVLVYLVVVMVRVGLLGHDMGGGTTADVTRYPYTFLDPALSGAGGVALFCLSMLVAFVALGFVMVGIDRLLARIARR